MSDLDTVALAVHYASLGWPVVPVSRQSKIPAWKEWTRTATTCTAHLVEWFVGHPVHNIGIVTGNRSRLLALDVDGLEGEESLLALQDVHMPLPETVESLTGGGGRHLLLALSDHDLGLNIGSGAGVLGPKLDHRCNGGFFVAPPSVHKSGRRYEWELSSDPLSGAMPTLAPRWLIEVLTPPAPHRAVHRTAALSEDRDRPGDRITELYEPHEIIGDMLGGIPLRSPGGGEYVRWSRPPLPGEREFVPHLGATWDYRGGGTLNVFTSNWSGRSPRTGAPWHLDDPPLDPSSPCTSYSLFRLYAIALHDGDHSEAARELALHLDESEIDDWVRSLRAFGGDL